MPEFQIHDLKVGAAARGDVVAGFRRVFSFADNLFGGPTGYALSNVTLEIYRGEVFAFVGPPGSGKTTALRLLSGRFGPSEGRVRVFGRSPRRAASRSRLTYVSARDSGGGRKRPVAVLQRLVHLVTFGAVGNERRTAGAVWERTRSAELARSLLKGIELVILDDPLDGLEPVAHEEMRGLIVELARRGKTVVISSRSLADVWELCDRVAVCNGGVVEQTGTVAELLATPGSLRSLAPVLSAAMTDRILRLIGEDLHCESCIGQAGRNPPRQSDSLVAQTEQVAAFDGLPPPTARGPAEAKPDSIDHGMLAALARPVTEATAKGANK